MVCDFFRRLLRFYRVELCLLNPNSTLHISIYIHLCEAFLGIEPHWALFCHLFCMKPTSSSSRVVGKADIQFKQNMRSLYIDYPPKDSVKDWNKEWFYVWNHTPQLQGRSGCTPEVGPHRFSALTTEQAVRIPELLEMIQNLKEQGLTGFI